MRAPAKAGSIIRRWRRQTSPLETKMPSPSSWLSIEPISMLLGKSAARRTRISLSRSNARTMYNDRILPRGKVGRRIWPICMAP